MSYNEKEFNRKYPNVRARDAADVAVDEAEKNNRDLTLDEAASIWNDTYVKIAGNINYNRR